MTPRNSFGIFFRSALNWHHRYKDKRYKIGVTFERSRKRPAAKLIRMNWIYMSAPREIMNQVVKTLKPMNDVVTEFVSSASRSDFGGDRLLLQLEGLGKAFGPMFSKIEKSGDNYQGELTRHQLASICIYYRESISLLQIGAESRLEAADQAIKDEMLIDSLINKPLDEDQIKSSDMIAMCQHDDLIERLAAGIRREMRKNPDDLSKLLARSMVNNTSRLQDDTRVISLFKDLVIGEITSSKDTKSTQDPALNGKAVTTTMGDNVIKIHFPRPGASKVNQAMISV